MLHDARLLLFPLFLNERKTALQFGSEIGCCGRDVDGFSNVVPEPLIKLLRRSYYAPAFAPHWHVRFRPALGRRDRDSQKFGYLLPADKRLGFRLRFGRLGRIQCSTMLKLNVGLITKIHRAGATLLGIFWHYLRNVQFEQILRFNC
jgi:hypothetical protein